MDFSLTPEQQSIRDAILKHCERFPDEYWLGRDRDGVFPQDFYDSLRDAGWLGIAMPAQFGGSGLGITEAALMMQAIAESGAGMTGASSVHIPVFSVQPVVLFGTPAQKERILPAVVSGKDRVCFAVTEPDAGLNTTEIKTRAERREGGYLVNGRKIWISTAHLAKWGLFLVRTDPTAIDQRMRNQSIERSGRDRAPFSAIRIQPLDHRTHRGEILVHEAVAMQVGCKRDVAGLSESIRFLTRVIA